MTKIKLKVSIFVLIVLMSLPFSLLFAWPIENGVVICNAVNNQLGPQIAPDGSGGAIITWYDNNIDAQRINSDGSTLWAANGISICNAPNTQDNPRIISDGSGGAIITWKDYRTNGEIYAQRINGDGTTLWTVNGVAICTAQNQQNDPQLVSDGLGGAIITWYDYRNGTDFDVYAQRINSSGSTLWSFNGIAICTASNHQEQPILISDDSGGAIIIWDDYRDGANRNIFAQRVNSDGSTLWDMNGIAITNYHNGNSFLQLDIASDSSGGAIITWSDGNIYAQRVNSSGSILWNSNLQSNGIPICTSNNDQWFPKLASNGTNGAIIVWQDKRDGSNWDIYGQQVNSEGSTLWVVNGVSICTVSTDQVYPQLVADGYYGAIIAWTDGYVYAQRIDNNGTQLWNLTGILICSVYNSNSHQLIKTGDGEAIITWDDKRNNYDTNIYAQRIYSNGVISSDFSVLPDVKLISSQALTTAFVLSDYIGESTDFWIWYANGYANITINNDQSIDYFITSPTNYIGEDTVNFLSNLGLYGSIVKYSTYLLKKLPRVIVDNGTGIENTTIDLSQYVSPSIPLSWPDPEIRYTNSNDSANLIALISGNTLTITPNTILQFPAEVIITATPDSTSNDWDKEIVRVYEVQNNYGLFNSSSDTSQWAYENAPNTTIKPIVSFLNTYNGSSGVLRLGFGTANQGIKMTLGKSNWLVSSIGQWYTVRMKVMSDIPNNTISPTLYIYNGVFPNPFDVSAHSLVSTPTTWTWLETAVYCEFTSSLYPQLVIKNGNSIGNIYIDAIEIIQAKPGIELAYGNTRIANSKADWDDTNDTTAWAFETPTGSTQATYSLFNSQLQVSFNGTTTQGLKLTGSPSPGITATSQITQGLSAGMKMKINTSGTISNPLVLLAVFGTTSSGSANLKELGATASVFRVPSRGEIEASYIPTQPYIFGQIQVKNSGNAQFFLDDAYLQADMDSPYYWDHTLFE